jgi:hypothetical protein
MKEFMLIFRSDPAKIPSGSPEEMRAVTQRWMDWIAGIAAQGKLADRGNRLEGAGRVVKNDIITDGPFCELKEMVGGYTLVRTALMEEAETIAKACPILSFGGSVEVREISRLPLPEGSDRQ